MPRVDIVQKHNTAARRLFIRGHNGKIYPYLVVNDSGLGDARREERVLQLLRMLNHYLGKQKVRESTRCLDILLYTSDSYWSWNNYTTFCSNNSLILVIINWWDHCKDCQLSQETSRRFLHFTVPRVVAVSPQMRLIEDNPASISLLDIYKQGCARVGLEHDSPVLRYYERLAAVQVQ